MNSLMLTAALATLLAVAACDKPTVVNVPPAQVGVPGPAGATGATGATGSTGATGKAGDGTTIIVTPAASAPN
jgi:hypothetical protein